MCDICGRPALPEDDQIVTLKSQKRKVSIQMKMSNGEK